MDILFPGSPIPPLPSTSSNLDYPPLPPFLSEKNTRPRRPISLPSWITQPNLDKSAALAALHRRYESEGVNASILGGFPYRTEEVLGTSSIDFPPILEPSALSLSVSSTATEEPIIEPIVPPLPNFDTLVIPPSTPKKIPSISIPIPPSTPPHKAILPNPSPEKLRPQLSLQARRPHSASRHSPKRRVASSQVPSQSDMAASVLRRAYSLGSVSLAESGRSRSVSGDSDMSGLPFRPQRFSPNRSLVTTPPLVDSPQSFSGPVQKWHVLMELISTELGYLADLRILVEVYLFELRSSPTLAPTPTEYAMIARNAEDILKFHESFAIELKEVSMNELGPNTSAYGSTEGENEDENVERAINAVCRKFLEKAHLFHIYEPFCSSHTEALDLIRMKLHTQSKQLEWHAFEKRCASIALGPIIVPNSSSPSAPQSLPSTVRKPARMHSRRHSADAVVMTKSAGLEGSEPIPSALLPPAPLPLSAPSSGTLSFRDFLIKPVQRICKYPLIISQLQRRASDKSYAPKRGRELDRKATEGTLDVVEEALAAMRGVASNVDNARKMKDIETKTKLVRERLETHPTFTSDVLASLDSCVLTGSLDVLYHHTVLAPLATPVKVKYLGAFLYSGYLLLVKVKKGKVYELRHWFSLSSMEFVDVKDDDGLLSNSFRLSAGNHFFELGAACLQEKVIWMRTIADTREAPAGNGVLELPEPSYLMREFNPPRIVTNANPTSDISASPTKRSSFSVGLSTSAPTSDEDQAPQSLSKNSSLSSRNRTLSKRSSTSNVRSMFTSTSYTSTNPDSATILVRRCSTQHRLLVDRGLGDVFSDKCLAARIQAQRTERLFSPPAGTEQTSSFGVAAKDKIKGTDSVLMAKRRSLIDTSYSDPSASPTTPISPNRQLEHGNPSFYQRRSRLVLPTLSNQVEADEDPKDPSTDDNITVSNLVPSSPSPYTSDASPYSGRSSAECLAAFPPSPRGQAGELGGSQYSSRSLRRSVRGFFSRKAPSAQVPSATGDQSYSPTLHSPLLSSPTTSRQPLENIFQRSLSYVKRKRTRSNTSLPTLFSDNLTSPNSSHLQSSSLFNAGTVDRATSNPFLLAPRRPTFPYPGSGNGGSVVSLLSMLSSEPSHPTTVDLTSTPKISTVDQQRSVTAPRTLRNLGIFRQANRMTPVSR